MPQHTPGSAVIAVWPEAMDLETIGQYTSTSASTARDWVADGLLEPVALPGTFLRDKTGKVIASPHQRKLAKIIVLRADVDAFLRRCRGDS